MQLPTALLLDPARTSGVRTRVDFTLTPSTVQARRLYTYGTDFSQQLRDLGARRAHALRQAGAAVGAEGGSGQTEHDQGLPRAVVLAVIACDFGEPVGHVRLGHGDLTSCGQQSRAQGV